MYTEARLNFNSMDKKNLPKFLFIDSNMSAYINVHFSKILTSLDI